MASTEDLDMGVFYVGPDGQMCDHPSRDFLHELVMRRGNEYWQSGTGDAVLGFNDRREELFLMMREQYGFHLRHLDDTPVRDYYVPVTSENYQDTGVIYVGGDVTQLPLAFFISRELAWIAVQEFLHTGGRAPELTWVPLSEQLWDDGLG